MSKYKVAIVHDYLREYGGAERVVEDLHELFPEAPVYTAYLNPEGLGIHWEMLKNWDIRTSWMIKFPGINKLLSAFRVFAPLTFEMFDLSEYDVVISSANVYFSTAVITKPETLHIAYIHTPAKMLYGYTTSYNYKKHWWTRIGGELANHFLRIYDFEIAQRPDILVANSKNVAARIKKFYRREAEVIYPGVDVSKGMLSGKPTQASLARGGGKVRNYYLCVNRLTRGKGTEIVVAACTKLNLPLKVAGSGLELERLRKIAGPTIQFLGHVSDSEKEKLYGGAIALIVATEQEDFGMTPPEAYAGGTPVIAARVGGYLETVVEGKTGQFFEVSADLGAKNIYVDTPSVNNLVAVLEKFDPKKYKPEDLKKQAEKFSKENFKKGILELVEKNFKMVK